MSFDESKPGARAKAAPIPNTCSDWADPAAEFVKALSHEGRLMILRHLLDGERTVTELEQHLGARQAAVSQQLARLRQQGLVESRRAGKTIVYSIGDARVRRILTVIEDLFADGA